MRQDEGELLTERELAKLEKRIRQEYGAAQKELADTITQYFADLAVRDEQMKKLIGTEQNGKTWTEADYRQWRLAQIGRGERFKALQRRIAERYTNARETAESYVNDATPGIYSLNRNYAAYTIEQVAGDVGFDFWDEQTVRRLLVEQPELMPHYPEKRAIKRGIDLAYGQKQIAASVTSGILQGKSLKSMADDLQERIPEMSRNSALRAARTAVTGAQNAGRTDSYAAAEKMGVKTKRKWVATLDNRTRHEHGELDGQVVAVDEPFEVGGYSLMFPGDPSGPPHLIYNCRCRIKPVVEGHEQGGQRRARDPETGRNVLIEDMTYAEWAGWKEKQPSKPMFAPAVTIEEAEEFAKQFVDASRFGSVGVSYKGVHLDIANEINQTINDFYSKFDVGKLGGIAAPAKNTKLGKMVNAHAAYSPVGRNLLLDRNKTKNANMMLSALRADQEAVTSVLTNPEEYDFSKFSKRVLNVIEASKETGRSIVADTIGEAITHELGHFVESQIKKEDFEIIKGGMAKYATRISGYAADSVSEYVAESFASYMKGEDRIDPAVREIFEKMRK